MSSIEKVSIALPTEMLALVKQAVDNGDYASNSEVVREALREWKARRSAVTLKDESRSVNTIAPEPRAQSSADGLALVQSHRRALNALCR